MNNESVLYQLQSHLGDKLQHHDESYGMLNITVHKDDYYDLIKWLKENKDMDFMFLTDLTAVHYPERTHEELCVVVHLHNLPANFRLRIKSYIPSAHPNIRSLTSIYKAANWMERETYDFYGIHFTGHPNLKRILNVDDMNYFPMLKQYPLEDQMREDKDDRYFGR
jgi:NADH-quinone oxidoreductase subunit C